MKETWKRTIEQKSDEELWDIYHNQRINYNMEFSQYGKGRINQ